MWIRQREGVVAPQATLEHRSALADWLESWTRRLAVPRNFWAEARANRRVGDLLERTLADWGYDVRVQGRYRNIVALPAHRSAKPLVLVSAHFDSVPRCPGADDNASGIAVVLACASALARAGSSVGFIAFNAEEDGLLGSRDFVSRGLTELAIEPCMVHVLEMVGFRARSDGSQRLPIPWPSRALRTGDFVGVIANPKARVALDAVLRSDVVPRPRCVGVQQWMAMDSLVPDLRRSDHFPFWEAQMPALLWTDTGNLRNPNYHCATDTPETLDYAFMAEVATLLLASLLAET